MSQTVDRLQQLIADSRELEQAMQRIQGERSLLLGDDEIAKLAEDYHAWFGRGLAALPEDYKDRFRAAYQGNWHSFKIKHFLEQPGATNPLWSEDNEIFGFWQHPFDTTFQGPLLEQRQILMEALQEFVHSVDNEALQVVERLCRRFSEYLEPLSRRGRDRPPMVVEDEYDVQLMLHGLLRAWFDDVRPEDFTPDRAGSASRVDFLLKEERIVVEAKMTRTGLGRKQIGEQLIVDIDRYRAHPDCDALVALVYDPERHITNRRALETDISGPREGIEVRIIIVQ